MEKLRLDLMHKNARFGRGAMLPIEREIYTFSSAAKIEPNGNRSCKGTDEVLASP
jgi:hypothetical protein